MSKVKIEIKNRWTGSVLFEYEKENNTIKETLEKAVEERADLRGAYLRGADLSGAYLSGAYLSGADLRGAYLRGAYLRGADLSGAYIYVSDNEIEKNEVIQLIENNSNLKILNTYVNKYVYPTRWNCFWNNGLIITEWEYIEPKKEVKRMTVNEVCEALGYEVEIVKEEK